MTYYERNLPHWFPDRRSVFLTWRLCGSLPRTFKKSSRDAQERKEPGEDFVEVDRELDRAKAGPVWLRDDRVASVVVMCLLKGNSTLRQFELHAFVVMVNHVHVLLSPIVEVRALTKGLKGTTARLCNRVLKRTGKSFWQDESFDHWVRDAAEFEKIRKYIEWNPVAAGLVKRPEDWMWSSANPRWGWGRRTENG